MALWNRAGTYYVKLTAPDGTCIRRSTGTSDRKKAQEYHDKIPLLVGGSMMYFKSLIEGLNDLPEADPVARMLIDTMAEEKGWPGVHEKLMEVDPETAARLDQIGRAHV